MITTSLRREDIALASDISRGTKSELITVGNATGERGLRRVLLATRGQGFLRVQLESLKEIAQLARLAHFWQVFPVLDRLGARVDHAFQSLQRQAAPPSKSLYIAAFALSPQGDTPPELVGEYFWLAFPRFYFGLSEAERAPFARYAGAMLERFLRRAQNREDLRHVALALHRLQFS